MRGGLCLLLLLAATRLCAADAPPQTSLDVAPTTLMLKAGEAGLFYVTNHGARPLTVEIEALDWRQTGDDGTDTYSPSASLVTSPPVAHIAPSARQSVRVMARPRSDGRESTYRLRVSELPDSSDASDGVHVLLQFLIPIFVGHDAHAAPQLAWDASITGGTLTVRNIGRETAKLSGLAVNGVPVGPQPFVYVLPGATHRFTSPAITGSLHIAGHDAHSGRDIAADLVAHPDMRDRIRRARLLLPGAVAVFLFAVRSAHAAPAPPPLLLEVWLNDTDQDRIVHVTLQGGHLLVAADDIGGLGLKLPAPDKEGLLDLSAAASLTARLDETGQRLLLSVPTASLPVQHYDLGRTQPSVVQDSTPATGAILHYDLSGTANDVRRWGRTANGGADFALDVFTPQALVSATGFIAAAPGGTRAVRLDSAISFEHPESLTHFTLGDAISVAPNWSRAVRFGGVEYASDFSLQPGLDTRPLPQFFGQSNVPATVDVFSGAAHMAQQSVQAGPFELSNLPIVSGGGTATIVTHDVLGRETTQTLSLYTDSDLLAPGIKSFAFDAGFLRTGYGVTSAGYGTPLLSATWRQGLADTLTLEGHGEASAGLAMISAGAAMGLGSFGALSADVAASTSKAGGGSLVALSANMLQGPITFHASVLAASAGYRDMAASGGTAAPTLRDLIGISANLKAVGALSINWIGSRYPGEAANQLLSASWSRSMGSGIYLAVTGLRDMTDHSASAQLTLSVPVGGGLTSLNMQQDHSGVSGYGLYDHPADPDGGLGYRMLGGWQEGGRAEADATWIGPHVGMDAGLSLSNGDPALRADVGGALVLLRGGIFATHDPGDAVALVETGDPDIRIYRENREVARSDADGEALLTGLNPYVANHIAVDPRDFPFDALVEKTDALVVPRRSAGAIVSFAPASRHPLLAMITRGAAMQMPVGAVARPDDGSPPLTLGHDGELFFADLDHPVGVDIDLGSSHCHVFIRPPAGQGTMPHTPALLCLREASGAY